MKEICIYMFEFGIVSTILFIWEFIEKQKYKKKYEDLLLWKELE